MNEYLQWRPQMGQSTFSDLFTHSFILAKGASFKSSCSLRGFVPECLSSNHLSKQYIKPWHLKYGNFYWHRFCKYFLDLSQPERVTLYKSKGVWEHQNALSNYYPSFSHFLNFMMQSLSGLGSGYPL